MLYIDVVGSFFSKIDEHVSEASVEGENKGGVSIFSFLHPPPLR